MSTAERWRRVAEGFTARVDAVPADAWERPSPCEGWTARDVVRHLSWTTDWLRGAAGLDVPAVPSADDPAAAWRTVRDAVQAVLDDDERAQREVDSPMGRTTVEGFFAMAGVPDVLVHTWDLARATGLDERLDADEVHGLAAGMAQVDEQVLVASGHYGPRVQVPDDADEQTRLLALVGRRA